MSSRPAIPISCFRCSSRGATESRHPSFDANPCQTKRSPSFKRRPFSKQHSRMSSSVPHCFTRQHITMPRRLRKRNVYEEVARLLDILGGEVGGHVVEISAIVLAHEKKLARITEHRRTDAALFETAILLNNRNVPAIEFAHLRINLTSHS